MSTGWIIRTYFPCSPLMSSKESDPFDKPWGTGAYTGSQGALGFRKEVAAAITRRDGHPSYPGNIFLSNGASTGIEIVLTTLVSSEVDGIMIPNPQYPIYSALIAKLTGRQVSYDLDESNNWSASQQELESQFRIARGEGIDVKGLVIINPGNPTGQVYSRQDLEIVCRFCADNGIVLLADEVYQRNVYNPYKQFFSAKKVAMETPGCESLQLVSFHSTSKGVTGECGRRGGYMELHNIDPYVQAQLYKLASSMLCSNVQGQIMTSLMMNPPQPGHESYEQFSREETEIFDGLKRRAMALVEGLNRVDGIDCNLADGSMYSYPRVKLPEKAIAMAVQLDITPDTMYALSLLNETGICVVPASGSGETRGRYGFRTTFLPPDDSLIPAVDLLASHYKRFCAKFA
jgi:aspartate/methionine/tyrosine aminotransferase